MKSYKKKYRKPSFYIGVSLLLILAALAIAAFFYTPYETDDVNYKLRLAAPSLKHLFGTDNMGRDVFSRVMEGLSTTCVVSLGIVAIGAGAGILVGAFTGYFGGAIDEIVMRINDTLAAFPSILLALVCVSLLGQKTGNVVLVLGVLFIPSFARVVRSEFIREKEKDYVKNARILGASHLRIIFVYILPNVKESCFVAAVIGINNAILAEAGLSFLGLGVQPPTPSLGRMMAEGQSFVLNAPWVSFFPGLAIVLMVLGFSLVSETFETGGRVLVSGVGRKPVREFVGEKESAKTCTKDDENKESILSVKNLHVAVNSGGILTEVVNGLSFDVKKGEALGIVGESGSGKSMTVSAIMGLLKNKAVARADSIYFDAEEISSFSTKEMNKLRGKGITMVFQEPMTSLNPSKKIGRQIISAIQNHDKECSRAELKKIAFKAMEDAGIGECDRVFDSYPHQLSGGQRQRILIAMAIALKPKLIICDEPTTALDADVADRILDRLMKLRKEYNIALVFISHDLSVVGRLCEKVIVMKDGIKVEEGSFDKVMNCPEHEYVKELAGAGKWHEIFSSEKENNTGTDTNSVNIRTMQKETPEVSGENTRICTVSNLSVVFNKGTKKELAVLDDISFFVNKGECVGISGRSGSGKTTLLKAMLKMVKYDGKVDFKGRATMVFQDPYSSLNPSMKIGRMLDEVQLLHFKKLKKRKLYGNDVTGETDGAADYSKSGRHMKAVEMLEHVGLDESFMSRRPAELSGGQRQRVAIAMAVITRPEIVLLDEPVTALDVQVQEKVLKLLMQLRKDYGLTYLLISHDRNLLGEMCGRVVSVE